MLTGVIWQSDLLKDGDDDTHLSNRRNSRPLSSIHNGSTRTGSRLSVGSFGAADDDEKVSVNLSLLEVDDDDGELRKKSSSPFTSSASSLSPSTKHALQKLVERRAAHSPILLRFGRNTAGELNIMSLDSALELRTEERLRRQAFDRGELRKLEQLAQIGRTLSSRPSTAVSKKSCSVSDFPVETHSGNGVGLLGWKMRRMQVQRQRSTQKSAKRISFVDQIQHHGQRRASDDISAGAQRIASLQRRSAFQNPTTEQLSAAYQRRKATHLGPDGSMLSTYRVCGGEAVVGVQNLRMRTPNEQAAQSKASNPVTYTWRAQPKLNITKHLADELEKEIRETEKRLNGEADAETTLWRVPNEASLKKTYNMPDFYYKNLHMFDWFNDQYDLSDVALSS